MGVRLPHSGLSYEYLFMCYNIMNLQLFTEGIVVSFILLIISIPVMEFVKTGFPTAGQEKYYVATIIIGLLTHFLCEYSGLNSWYCKNGVACSNLNN